MALLWPVPTLAQEAQVRNELGRDRIYAGESVLYVVNVINAPAAEAPELGDMSDFEVHPLGTETRLDRSFGFGRNEAKCDPAIRVDFRTT